jgi:hypothetical protein
MSHQVIPRLYIQPIKLPTTLDVVVGGKRSMLNHPGGGKTVEAG